MFVRLFESVAALGRASSRDGFDATWLEVPATVEHARQVHARAPAAAFPRYPMTTKITGGPGVSNDVMLLGDDERHRIGPFLSIALSEPADSAFVWTLIVRARLHGDGSFHVGQIATTPPSAGDPAARLVAFAWCPGATAWHVQVNGPIGATGAIELASGNDGSLPPGIAVMKVSH